MSTVKNAAIKKTSTAKEKTASSSKKDPIKKQSEKKNATRPKASLSTKTTEEKEKDPVIIRNRSTLKREKNVETPIKNAATSSRSVKDPKLKPNAASTSNRVKKSQYFPSKNLFSNALKSMDMPTNNADSSITTPKSTVKSVASRLEATKKLAKSSPIRATIKKSLSPRIESPDSSSTLERPRTATLRKGSIVNENIVGPDAPKRFVKESAKNPKTSACPEENYEDDFESYESDFETESSSEDTNAAEISGESGSISTSSSEDVILEKEPSILPPRLSSAGTDGEKKLDSGTFELSDFKHRQILKYIEDTIKKEQTITESTKCNHPSLSDEGFEEQKSLQFINFADAKKKCEKRRASAARRKRGQELLSMIKLNAINFTIFDSPSIPYEEYIKKYGLCNSVQASSQTGEDNISEETQTEEINVKNKWTQMPCKFSSFDHSKEGFWKMYKSDCLGCGQDEIDDLLNSKSEINNHRLSDFLKRSGELVLQILAEETIATLDNLTKNKNDLPFSNGYIQFNTSLELLKNASVQNVTINSNLILSVHLNKESNSIVCIWDLVNFENPRTILISFGEVSCATFSLDCDRIILAGKKDGAVLIWNLDQRCEIASKAPCFTTPVGKSHLCKIVSIQQSHKQDDNIVDICTLDESGQIIFWTLYMETDSIKDIVLINTRTIFLQHFYPQFSDFTCSECILVDNHIYVSTNYGFVLHCLVKGKRDTVKMFMPDTLADSTCLEPCPFSKFHFLAAYSNGDISLFSKRKERPLLILQNKEQMDGFAVQTVRWSKSRPFLIYAKDVKNVLHIWDLYKSDVFPEYSIRFPDEISCLELSPLTEEKEGNAYMIIGTRDGKLFLHLLSEEHGRGTIEKHQSDVKIFLNYLNRL